jgi:transposase
MRSVALDLSVRKISYCEVRGGQVVQRATVRELDQLETLLGHESPPARVAIEACREAWVVYDQLREWGNEPVLLDTTRVQRLGIGEHGRKTDRIDAELLARAVEKGQLPVAHVLSPGRRRLRYELGVRAALVEMRAQYVTTVRGLLRALGYRIASCAVESFVRKVCEAHLDDATQQMVAPILTVLEVLGPQIAAVEDRLALLCDGEPTVRQLMSAPGVGLVVAASVVAVIDDAKRFRNAHQVESYFGLVPSEFSSGARTRMGAITKHGNRYARAMLVQAAHKILRLRDQAEPLKMWGSAIAARRGTRIAVIALARRLVGVLWAMWRDGTVYDAGAVGRASARGLDAQARQVQRQSDRLRREAAARAEHKIRRLRSARQRTEVLMSP